MGEPKSTHTWLDGTYDKVYAYDIDIRITDFPSDPNRSWLYYFSLQVNFTSYNEWSHGGFQWSGTKEFADNNNKGVNWGGGADWAGYGGLGVNNTPFTWDLNKWYRYRVWRMNDDEQGFHRWLFAVHDYDADVERRFGTIRSKSSYIAGAVVWIETGYGVVSDTPTARVEWRSPKLYTGSGIVTPKKLIASYNGTCSNPHNTNQGLSSTNPLTWFQQTNTPRTVQDGTVLWSV